MGRNNCQEMTHFYINKKKATSIKNMTIPSNNSIRFFILL